MNTRADAATATEFYGDIMILLKDVIGGDLANAAGQGQAGQWVDSIGPTTRLDGDLLMDSIEITTFSHRLSERYGDDVDLVALIATLGIDEIIALTVADVAALVAAHAGTSDAQIGSR